jgi:hypothetical protein
LLYAIKLLYTTHFISVWFSIYDLEPTPVTRTWRLKSIVFRQCLQRTLVTLDGSLFTHWIWMIFFTLNQLLILVILLFIRNMEFSTAFGTIWPQKESIIKNSKAIVVSLTCKSICINSIDIDMVWSLQLWNP